jgi:UDP-N-acetylmuramoylalanine-D-glutamate ligase
MGTTIKLASNTNCEAALLSPACASFDMFDNFEHIATFRLTAFSKQRH